MLSLDYGIELTSFETPEIGMLLEVGGKASASDPADQFVEPPADKPAVSRTSDL
jgi:hypothetical protein